MKWTSLLISCFLLLGLVGCSEGTENEKESDAELQNEEKALEDERQSEKNSEEDSEETIPEASEKYEDAKGEQSTGGEIERTVKDQFNLINDQLVASGYAPLDEWHTECYQDEMIGHEGMYNSQFIGDTATLSILDNGEQITCVTVAVPSDEKDAYEKLCSVFSACTLNIFFTDEELVQIHDKLENAETNTDVVINDHTVNYSEGIDILILGGG